MLRRFLWLEVRFVVRADYSLRAVVCSCTALDGEEGYNWYLFSLRIVGNLLREEEKTKPDFFFF